MEEQIISKMVDGNEFDVPESVIDSVIHAMFEDFRKQYGKPGQPANLDFDTMAEGLYPIAEKTVRWEIIRNNIIKKENLEVEDQDIEELVEIEKTRTKGDPETIRRALLQNKNITENILHKKVMDFILDFAVTNEVSFDDIAHEHEHNHDHEHEHHHDHEHEHHHEHEHDHEHEN
jgi:FKBP-type peptidyl-prolyl cis-trans isomerase (trigger factor)